GAASRFWAGSARRSRGALRRGRMRRRDPRPPARPRPDAGAAERRRPAALPRLAPNAVRRRRRLPCAAGAVPLMAIDTSAAQVRSLELSAAGFLRIALASVGALWLIILTGAAVRLTDSGLGCRHWPGCEPGHP